MSALSDFRAAVVARLEAITGYGEAPGGDPEQIPESWTAGFIVDVPAWQVEGDGSVVVLAGEMSVSLWYRADQIAYDQGAWMSAWEAIRAQLESRSWSVAGNATITVVGAESDRVGDRFVGRVLAAWTLTYSR